MAHWYVSTSFIDVCKCKYGVGEEFAGISTQALPPLKSWRWPHVGWTTNPQLPLFHPPSSSIHSLSYRFSPAWRFGGSVLSSPCCPAEATSSRRSWTRPNTVGRHYLPSWRWRIARVRRTGRLRLCRYESVQSTAGRSTRCLLHRCK